MPHQSCAKKEIFQFFLRNVFIDSLTNIFGSLIGYLQYIQMGKQSCRRDPLETLVEDFVSYTVHKSRFPGQQAGRFFATILKFDFI